jgi:hypothetical protein
LRNTLGNGSLTHARITNQDGIIFGTSTKDLDGASDFVIAADDGVEFSFGRSFG